MRQTITIDFFSTALGRIDFEADVMTYDKLSFKSVAFKLDSGSDFTTLSCDDLILLGYEEDYLKTCKFHINTADPAFGTSAPIQYIENISLKFGDRELQGCRVFFVLNSGLRSLLGSDILKYFNYEVDYEAHQDSGELRLIERKVSPVLAEGETRIHIYSLESEANVP
jgi:hypothetical protein